MSIRSLADVWPVFGRLQDCDDLVASAHKLGLGLGLKVVIDQVLNHRSDKHPGFVASRSSRDTPKADWHVWKDADPDGSPPNTWLSVFGGSAWQWDAALSWCSTCRLRRWC